MRNSMSPDSPLESGVGDLFLCHVEDVGGRTTGALRSGSGAVDGAE